MSGRMKKNLLLAGLVITIGAAGFYLYSRWPHAPVTIDNQLLSWRSQYQGVEFCFILAT